MIYKFCVGVKDLGGIASCVSKIFPTLNHSCLLLNNDLFEYGANYNKSYDRIRNVNKNRTGFDWNELSALQGKTRVSPDELERAIIKSGKWHAGHYKALGHNCHDFVQFCLREIGCSESMINKNFFVYLRQEGEVQIRSALGKKNLDIECCNYSNYANIILYQAHGEFNQKFKRICNRDGTISFLKFVPVGLGYVKYALDVKCGKAENGNSIHLYKNNGTNAQKFILKEESGGYYSILSYIDTRYAIDVDVDTSKIQLWEYHGGKNQLFKFIE